mmetsp:Transcript_10552/g.21971  ORF Transcript_10552/g.21971 Transcript_10552/m.21971 type:complete len:246 (-) Transcript_10552:1194-1931(-)
MQPYRVLELRSQLPRWSMHGKRRTPPGSCCRQDCRRCSCRRKRCAVSTSCGSCSCCSLRSPRTWHHSPAVTGWCGGSPSGSCCSRSHAAHWTKRSHLRVPRGNGTSHRTGCGPCCSTNPSSFPTIPASSCSHQHGSRSRRGPRAPRGLPRRDGCDASGRDASCQGSPWSSFHSTNSSCHLTSRGTSCRSPHDSHRFERRELFSPNVQSCGATSGATNVQSCANSQSCGANSTKRAWNVTTNGASR